MHAMDKQRRRCEEQHVVVVNRDPAFVSSTTKSCAVASDPSWSALK